MRNGSSLLAKGLDSPDVTTLPYKLVDYAKKNPGKLSYSTTGSGGALV